MLGYLVLISLSGPDLSLFGWPKRALRLALVLTALMVWSPGGSTTPPRRGMAVGLLGNAVLFFAGVAPAPYGLLCRVTCSTRTRPGSPTPWSASCWWG